MLLFCFVVAVGLPGQMCVCIFVFVCILYVMERIVCLITTPPTYFLAKDILVAATVRDRILILV